MVIIDVSIKKHFLNNNKKDFQSIYSNLLEFKAIKKMGLLNFELTNNDYIEEYNSLLKETNFHNISLSTIKNIKGFAFIVNILPLPQNNSFYQNEMNGIVAYTIERKIYIHISPIKFINNINVFESLLIHEFQHVLRNFLFKSPKSLLDVLIDEGLSELFVKEMLGEDRVNNWALKNDECILSNYYQIFFENILCTDKKFISEFLNGSNDKKIPLWLGYSLGYRIVDAFRKKNKGIDLIDIIKISSSDILKVYENHKRIKQ